MGGAEGVGRSIPLIGLSSLRIRELNGEKHTSKISQRKCVAAPVEGVNFQALKDLKSLASAAARKGPANTSKWLSAQNQAPEVAAVTPSTLLPPARREKLPGAHLGNDFYIDSPPTHTHTQKS